MDETIVLSLDPDEAFRRADDALLGKHVRYRGQQWIVTKSSISTGERGESVTLVLLRDSTEGVEIARDFDEQR